MLLDEWSSCSGDWKKGDLYKKFKSKTKNSSFGSRRWLTRAQIAKKYEDSDIANQICDAKLADPQLFQTHTKWHPDKPGIEASMVMYVSDCVRFHAISLIKHSIVLFIAIHGCTVAILIRCATLHVVTIPIWTKHAAVRSHVILRASSVPNSDFTETDFEIFQIWITESSTTT